MPIQKADTKERKKILSDATADFIDKFEEIQTFINDECTTLIQRRHKLGQIAVELSDDKEKYGKKSLETMSKLISIDPAILYRCKSLAEKYDDKAIVEVIDARNVDGDALSWSHVSLLSSIDKKDTRDKIMNLCLSKSWTVGELNAEIQRLKGKKVAVNTSKKAPAGFEVYIANITSMLNQLTDKAKDVWMDEQTGIMSTTESIKSATKEHFDKLDKLSVQIDNVIDVLNQVDNTLTKTKVRLEKARMPIEAKETKEIKELVEV